MTWHFRPSSHLPTPASLSLKELFLIGFLLALLVFLGVWGVSEVLAAVNPTFPAE
jgi:hypothetical protein